MARKRFMPTRIPVGRGWASTKVTPARAVRLEAVQKSANIGRVPGRGATSCFYRAHGWLADHLRNYYPLGRRETRVEWWTRERGALNDDANQRVLQDALYNVAADALRATVGYRRLR